MRTTKPPRTQPSSKKLKNLKKKTKGILDYLNQ